MLQMPLLARASLVFLLLLALLEAASRGLSWFQSALPASGLWFVYYVEMVGIWYASLLLFAVPVTLVERLLPGSPRHVMHYGRALLYWAVYMPFSVAAVLIVQWLSRQLGTQPLLNLRLDDWQLQGLARTAANAGLLVLYIVVFDLFLYWFHRMEHRVALFWRLHRAHHAIRSLNALGCYHHPLEDILRIPFFLLPMALLFRIEAPSLVVLSAFLSAWAYISHMDSAMHFGALRHVFVDNRYHRLHHSMDSAHFDCNFASYFAPWDRLFGTQRMPDIDARLLRVGLADVAEPASLRALWHMPFQRLP